MFSRLHSALMWLNEIVSASGIRQRGCIRTRTIMISELTSARWGGNLHGGSLMLRRPGCKVVVYFDNFSPDDRAELIQFFRASLDAGKQENWPAFESESVVPAVASRRGWVRGLIVAALFSTIASFFGFTDLLLPGKPRNVPAAIANAVAGAWYLCRAWRSKRHMNSAPQMQTNNRDGVQRSRSSRAFSS